MHHPAPECVACLMTPDSAKSRQKGGTLMALEVTTLEEHRNRLADPGGYRPRVCGHCEGERMHAHELRSRVLRNDPKAASTKIRIYLCLECHAVWRVLPGFLARWLHRRWAVVQSAMVEAGALAEAGGEIRGFVPERTVRRWRARLASGAMQVAQVLAEAGEAVVEAIAVVGSGATRACLVEALARAELVRPTRKLAEVGGWVHQLVPGIRLM